MGISQADLAGIRSLETDFMPTKATNSRTGARVFYRLTDQTTRLRLQGMPRLLNLPEWDIKLPDGTDIAVGDRWTLDTGAEYATAEAIGSSTYSTFNLARCYQLGPAQACSTLRQPTALDVGQTAGYTTHLAALSVRALQNVTFHTQSPQFVQDAFGVALENPAVVYADWPTGNTEQLPIQPNDVLVFPDATQYVVAGVETQFGWYLAITVEMAFA